MWGCAQGPSEAAGNKKKDDLTAPLSGMVCTRGLALATVNVPTNFEVSNSTHYEDTKGDTKCRNWGGLA